LVGGLAVSARTEPRFTRDADIAVAVDSDAEAEALIHRLRVAGYEIETIVEQEAVGRLATARLTRSQEPATPVIDLLFASSGIEAEIVAEADEIELLSQLPVRVATTGHLIALKVLARDDVTRPQDVSDLRALLGVASAGDVTQARAALTLIAKRGYHRGRDLQAELEMLLRTFREQS
jgi:predicted nucleotidyltransferase